MNTFPVQALWCFSCVFDRLFWAPSSFSTGQQPGSQVYLSSLSSFKSSENGGTSFQFQGMHHLLRILLYPSSTLTGSPFFSPSISSSQADMSYSEVWPSPALPSTLVHCGTLMAHQNLGKFSETVDSRCGGGNDMLHTYNSGFSCFVLTPKQNHWWSSMGKNFVTLFAKRSLGCQTTHYLMISDLLLETIWSDLGRERLMPHWLLRKITWVLSRWKKWWCCWSFIERVPVLGIPTD